MKCRCPKCGYVFFAEGTSSRIITFLKIQNNDLKRMLKKGKSNIPNTFGANISEISKSLNISRPVIYHHLKPLIKKKIVSIIQPSHLKLKGNPKFVKLSIGRF